MSKLIEATLIGCAGLLGKQDNGFSDPVVHLNCNGVVQVSSVKQATNSPVWNEKFSWTLPSASRPAPLTLHVWNSPKFEIGPDTKGAFLGTVTVDDVLKVIGKTCTFVLEKRSSRSNVSGSISIRIDDDASKLAAESSNSAAAQPLPAAAQGCAASDSKSSPESGCSRNDVVSDKVSLSPADAALLNDFVSKSGNEQCADCDSKQVNNQDPPSTHLHHANFPRRT
jgi:hypothetical protein